jgi:hypothetical protein
MSRADITPQIIVAFVITLIAIGLVLLTLNQTTLLVEPSPDLDWPLGLLGAGAGLWSASRITRLPPAANHRLGPIALLIMLPIWLAFGLVALGNRAQEAISFRHGTVQEEATVAVLEKSTREGRRSRRVFYEAEVANPFDGSEVTVRMDEGTFRRIAPAGECATILIERAPDGAARLVRPLRWQVPCPTAANRPVAIQAAGQLHASAACVSPNSSVSMVGRIASL